MPPYPTLFLFQFIGHIYLQSVMFGTTTMTGCFFGSLLYLLTISSLPYEAYFVPLALCATHICLKFSTPLNSFIPIIAYNFSPTHSAGYRIASCE